MTTVASTSGLSRSQLHQHTDMIGAIPDPRSPSHSPQTLSRTSSMNPFQHPELNSEVATLSNKLINAINHQTNLDDTLAATRHELDNSKARTRQLEATTNDFESMMSKGILVKKKDIEAEMLKVMADLAEERKQRRVAEKARKDMEQELENLTTALFEEANQMVAAARKEREPLERKNEQLKAQLNDTELLLASHQEQLADLKSVMQQMGSERDEVDTNTNVPTSPSTPPLGSQDNLTKAFEALHLSPNAQGSINTPPAHPTSFPHLVQPVLRTDLQAVDDFYSLLRNSRLQKPPSRVSSGSYGGLNLMGVANLTTNTPPQPLVHVPSNGSTSSASTSGTYSSSPSIPSTPASANSSVSSRDVPQSSAPLKETRFYKRTVVEDIEPTLRLDAAPGLSWLARRAVLNSMSEGSLVVEPVPSTPRLHHFACSLCGENRKGEEYTRGHRFRTSESDSAQLYPLCKYCLGRVRSVCDFLGFLRMVKDGHWRTDGEEGEKAAWEESVRLRERMFWARVGGGVVPAFINARDSPRSSTAEEIQRRSQESHKAEDLDTSNAPLAAVQKDLFHSDQKKASIGRKIIFSAKDTSDGGIILSNGGHSRSKVEDDDLQRASAEDQSTAKSDDICNAAPKHTHKGEGQDAAPVSSRNLKSKSISIPGAFE
ncbi:MAG: rab guanine nucleotide exchange factor S2 [Candelina submexicana]|nr:MAG: rab guanine nucleotide exchange factor S2 [Candelina submexicana]